MADLRIVDAPVLLQESITDDVKMPTGGLGNFSVRLGDILWYVITKEQLANKNYVDLSSKSVKDSLDVHIADKANPHQVTKEQVGLGNVNNTADIDKPVSDAVSSAIITATNDMATKAYVNQKDNLKADKATTLSGYGITDAYTKDETRSKIEIDNALTLKADVAYVNSKDGDLTTLKTADKTNLVKAVNEIHDVTKGVVALYDKNVEAAAAGAGANGWTDLLVSTKDGRTQRDKNNDSTSVKDFGAIGDGSIHTVNDWTIVGSKIYYKDLAAIQSDYPFVTALTDTIDYATLQKAINYCTTYSRALYLHDTRLNIGTKTITVKDPLVMFGASNLGRGSCQIIYSGNDTAIRFKRDNFDSGDFTKWIYAANLYDFAIIGTGGNAKTALELWACSECNFNRLTIGGGSNSHFKTGIEMNTCSGLWFGNVVGSYNDVMYDFKVAPVSRYRPNAIIHVVSGDYYDNNTMFKCNSVSGLYVSHAWIESCDDILVFDDTIDEIEADNIFFSSNNCLMNIDTSNKILSIKNNIGKKSRVVSAFLKDNILRYTNGKTNTLIPIDIKTYESSSGYNSFNVTVENNAYYGQAAALIDSNDNRVTLSNRYNQNINPATGLNTIPDTLPTAVFTGSSISAKNNSTVIGRTAKNRYSTEALIIDNANGDVSSIGIYQKAGNYSPLLATYASNGTMLGSINADGSLSTPLLLLSSTTIKINYTVPSGYAKAGDIALNNLPSATNPVTMRTCVAEGTPATWKQSAHVVYSGTTAQRPAISATDIGVMYFDTTLAAKGKPIWWTGSKWVDASGNQV